MTNTPEPAPAPSSTQLVDEQEARDRLVAYFETHGWVNYAHPASPFKDITVLATRPASSQELEELAEQALRDVCDPVGYLRRQAEAEGHTLNGLAYSIANDLHFVQEIARKALTDLAGKGTQP